MHSPGEYMTASKWAEIRRASFTFSPSPGIRTAIFEKCSPQNAVGSPAKILLHVKGEY